MKKQTRTIWEVANGDVRLTHTANETTSYIELDLPNAARQSVGLAELDIDELRDALEGAKTMVPTQ